MKKLISVLMVVVLLGTFFAVAEGDWVPDPGAVMGLETEYSFSLELLDGIPYDIYTISGELTVEEVSSYIFRYVSALEDFMGWEHQRINPSEGYLISWQVYWADHIIEISGTITEKLEKVAYDKKHTWHFDVAVPSECNFTIGVPPIGIRDGHLICFDCKGSRKCSSCGGVGSIYFVGYGRDECPVCDGYGECTICDGTGIGD